MIALVATLLFAPQEAPPRPDPDALRLEFYDVRDLCQPKVFQEQATDDETLARYGRAGDLLVSYLKSLIELRSSGTLSSLNGALILRADGEGHDDVRAVLAGLRGEPRPQILMEFRLLKVSTERGDPVLREAGIVIDDVSPVGHSAHALGEQTHGPLLEQLKQAGADVLNAPRVMSLPLEPWSISSLAPIAYVRSWKEFDVQGSRILDPQVEILQEGLEVSGLAVGLPARPGEEHWLALSVDFSDRRVHRPIPTEQTPLGEIQCPETSTDRFSFESVVRGGSSVLLVGPAKPNSDATATQRSLLMLRATALHPEPDEDVQQRIQRLIEQRKERLEEEDEDRRREA